VKAIREHAYQSLRRMGYSRAEAAERVGVKYAQAWQWDLNAQGVSHG
jgi:hypothetical protein